MNTAEIEDYLRLSRAYCAQLLPWFAPGLFTLRFRLSEQVPIAGVTDKWVVYWNPKAVETIVEGKSKQEALSQLGFIWIHELSHLLREHSRRRAEIGAKPLIWNVVCDLEINDSNWRGLKMPTDFMGLLPSQFGFENGKLAEQYLGQLKSDKSLTNSDVVQVHPNEGSGVHGEAQPWENPNDSKDSPSEIIQKATQRAVAQGIKEAAKNRGNLPVGWERWAEAIIEHKVDWRKLLKAKIRASLTHSLGQKIDYSYARPSRRQTVYAPIVTPRLMGSTDTRIACVVDTSGSIGTKELSLMLGEICGILQTFNSPVHIIPCDARAYDAIKVGRKSDILRIESLAGGGGTDMRVGVEAALQIKPKPDVVVVLTDGYTPWPEDNYDVQIVFGVFHHENQSPPMPPNPPWGEDCTVEIEL